MSDPVAAAPIPAPDTPPISLTDLFVAFLTISLSGFGGVLAWSRRMVVDRRRWMSAEEFNEAYALCQMLPGPNIVNFSVVFGSRFRGPLGAAIAFAGLLGPPVVIVTVFGIVYAHYGQIDSVQRVLAGVSAAAAGLIIGTTAKMSEPLFEGGWTAAPLIALITFVAIGIMRWPIHWVLLVLLPLGFVWAWWRHR
ncbi:MAG TPA: chromate transporter [Xanthobacteraceae bacterium]|jgi:chromate transporter